MMNYRAAAEAFWPGPWVDLAYDGFDIINDAVYGGALPPLPIVFGLTPHGKSLGFCTRESTPRITLHSSLINPKSAAPWHRDREQWNPAALIDVLTHELIHAHLIITDRTPDHNAGPWCAEIERQSPTVGVGTLTASPWKRARVGTTLTYKPTTPGSIPRVAISTWPYSVRPDGYYLDQRPWYER
jgi:hypothetical protein